MIVDEWGVVYNDEHNFKGIAESLKAEGRAAFAWTDGIGTQFDFIMVHQIRDTTGRFQGRVNPKQDLMVGIVRKGLFGFDIYGSSGRHPSYIAEKLFLSENITTEKVTELINGVISNLRGE